MALVLTDIRCTVRLTTGLPCPGCGMTRAYLALIQGDFAGAFFWHPLFWMVIPLFLLAAWKKGKIFRSEKANHIFWYVLAGVFIIVYIVRMVLYFPDTPPMDYTPWRERFRFL